MWTSQVDGSFGRCGRSLPVCGQNPSFLREIAYLIVLIDKGDIERQSVKNPVISSTDKNLANLQQACGTCPCHGRWGLILLLILPLLNLLPILLSITLAKSSRNDRIAYLPTLIGNLLPFLIGQ